MWKIIDSSEIPFTPYPKGVSSIKRIVEKEKIGAQRISGFGLIQVPPAGVFGPHEHPEREEIYYVLSGSGMLIVGGEEIPAREGLALYVSGEEPHGLRNQGEEQLIVVFVTVYK
ncbi:MAG: cupin domain-containing protein [Candidatus Brockarchaeota archaeon]|nr:cupin domain-containing protein [Candidatus Brockarchaeota archaeon]